MQNITLKVDEKVLAGVRRYVVLKGTTVNALVRRFLGDIAERQDRARKARQRIRALSNRSGARLGDHSWTRADLHDR